MVRSLYLFRAIDQHPLRNRTIESIVEITPEDMFRRIEPINTYGKDLRDIRLYWEHWHGDVGFAHQTGFSRDDKDFAFAWGGGSSWAWAQGGHIRGRLDEIARRGAVGCPWPSIICFRCFKTGLSLCTRRICVVCFQCNHGAQARSLHHSSRGR